MLTQFIGKVKLFLYTCEKTNTIADSLSFRAVICCEQRGSRGATPSEGVVPSEPRQLLSTANYPRVCKQPTNGGRISDADRWIMLSYLQSADMKILSHTWHNPVEYCAPLLSITYSIGLTVMWYWYDVIERLSIKLWTYRFWFYLN